MFADLDDPAPPTADSRIRARVQGRSLALAGRDRRRRRLARGSLVVALALFVLLAGLAVSGRGTPHPGPVIARWRFVGHPGPAQQRATVTVLDRRFSGAGMEARAQLADGGVAVTATGPNPPATAELQALTAPGRFELRAVIDTAPDPGPTYRGPLYPPTTQLGTSGQIIVTQTAASTPPGAVLSYVLGPAVEANGLIQSASTDLNAEGQWEVRPVFKPGRAGVDQFNMLADVCYDGRPACPTKQLALVLDGQVLTAPFIDAPSFERDQVTIAGEFTQAEVTRIAVLLNSGPLATELRR